MKKRKPDAELTDLRNRFERARNEYYGEYDV